MRALNSLTKNLVARLKSRKSDGAAHEAMT